MIFLNSWRLVWNKETWVKQHRDQGAIQACATSPTQTGIYEFHCTDIVCQSSWLMWISFFSTEHEIIVSALLWLGTRGPAKIIREKRRPSSQMIGNVSWTSVTAVVICEIITPGVGERNITWHHQTWSLIVDHEHDLWRWGENHLLVELNVIAESLRPDSNRGQ